MELQVGQVVAAENAGPGSLDRGVVTGFTIEGLPVVQFDGGQKMAVRYSTIWMVEPVGIDSPARPVFQ